jgi:hypothetical protein
VDHVVAGCAKAGANRSSGYAGSKLNPVGIIRSPVRATALPDRQAGWRALNHRKPLGVDAMSEPKPKGSGYFAALCGVLFMLAFVGSFFVRLDQLSPDRIMRAWLLFVAAILIWWGSNRVRTGRSDPTVGQDTIHLVIALVGATVALLGLFKR